MLVRHEFGPEGVAYLRSYFDSSIAFGKRLGRLLAECDLEAGNASAFVPVDISADRLADFESGGLFPSEREMVETSAAQDLVREWLLDRLTMRSPTPRLVCVEDALMRRSDSVLHDRLSDKDVFFCGEDVYWFATEQTSEDAVLHAGATWDPNIAMVTALPSDSRRIINRQSMDPETLVAMAEVAVGVAVGAWDREGFLLWEPSNTTSVGAS